MRPQLAPVSLAEIQRAVRVELDASFAKLDRVIAADFPLTSEVNEHLLRMKGKMFRPTLLLLSAKATGQITRRETTLAAVVELIHLATLVHDDSVDHSVLRRGQPTVNALFSHQVAVIMGDYLYSRAISELVALGELETLQVISRVTNDMTVGEMRQLQAHDVLDYTEDDYDALIRSKTASLVSGACELGALRGTQKYRDPLRRCGLLLGMAFQITDDVLDYTEEQATTGKPSGLDLREHKITLPLIAALPRMSASERGMVEQLMQDPAPSDELLAAAIEIVEGRGGVAAARERAHELALRAEAELDKIPAGDARDSLSDCISYAVERRK